MTCPVCGGKMNYHAEKIDYTITDPKAAIDPVFGAPVEEAYYCPRCHRTETRVEEAS
jgi:hypothetical protein